MLLGAAGAMALLGACGGSSSSSSTTASATSPSSSATGPGSSGSTLPGGSQAGTTVVYGWGGVGPGHYGPPHHGHRHALLSASYTLTRSHHPARLPLPVRDQPTAIKGIRGRVVQIATSNTDGYALTSTGAVYAWGGASNGELGDGSTRATWRAVRVDFPIGVHIASLPNPMPFNGGMAIDTAGRVFGWGNDAHHQFCLPSTSNLMKPVRLPLKDVTMAVGAARHTLYQSAGRLVGCGWNVSGELGDGKTKGDQVKPTPVKGLPSGQVKMLTASWGNEGVLFANGSYYDWGFDQGGQDGEGTTQVISTAQRVDLPDAVSQISEGGSLGSNGTTIAILADQQVWLWGNGQYGQIGNGRVRNALLPTRLHLPQGVSFKLVNSGGAAVYGIDQQGRLWAWGLDRVGQLGNGQATGFVTRPQNEGVRLSVVSSTAGVVAGYQS